MASTKLLSALLLLATAAALATAARPSSWERNAPHSIETKFKGDNLDAFRWIMRRHHGEQKEQDEQDEWDNRGGKHRAYVAIRYEVDPSLQDKFVEEWHKVKDEVKDEKDNIIFVLHKTRGDNLYWIVYGEWKDFRAYMDHFTSDYVDGWLGFLAENDITYELKPLEKITDDAQELAGRSDEELERRRGRGGRDEAAHIIINYHVPPSKVEDFIDMWEDTAKSTAKEKDNVIYSLRKIATNNNHYMVYGLWEDMGAYLDHFHSDHVRRLRDFADDNDLVWFLEPLKQFGSTEKRVE